jgi:hypothetical protein
MVEVKILGECKYEFKCSVCGEWIAVHGDPEVLDGAEVAHCLKCMAGEK